MSKPDDKNAKLDNSNDVTAQNGTYIRLRRLIPGLSNADGDGRGHLRQGDRAETNVDAQANDAVSPAETLRDGGDKVRGDSGDACGFFRAKRNAPRTK